MKTTGVVPDLFAASICPCSRSEIDAIENPLGRVDVMRLYRGFRF
jgi:hypothetical protein